MIKRVLIIEDEALLRELIVEILEHKGITPLQASNGVEGLNILKLEQVDLVLSDIDMPFKNGIEVLREFRSFNKTTPVVLMSGGASYSLNEILDLGAEKFISKPFRLVDFDNLFSKKAA